MLDVNNVNLQHLTKVIEKLKNLKTMSVRWTSIEKNGRRKAKYFKTNALVPKKAVLRKEEGATVAASHLPSPRRNSAGWSRKGKTGSDSPRRFYRKDL